MEDNPILKILSDVRKLGGSDIHLAPGQPVAVRLHGSIKRPWSDRIVTGESIRAFIVSNLEEDVRERIETKGSADGSLDDPSFGPIRLHAYRDTVGKRLTLRLLAENVARFETLGLPDVLLELTERVSGLILFVGPVGSGKTTAQNSLVERINETQEKHIITIEDPIEYRLKPRKSIVTQIEVGPTGHVKNFADALRDVLRSDPDVLLVGECRDPATMATCIEVAEQGRWCTSTVHARDASSTPDRIVGAFPADAQPMIRTALAESLTAIVLLRLVPRKDGQGRVAAAEVMIKTDGIRELIKENKCASIRNDMITKRDLGNQTLEQSLNGLVSRDIVDINVAKSVAVRPEEITGREKDAGDTLRNGKTTVVRTTPLFT